MPVVAASQAPALIAALAALLAVIGGLAGAWVSIHEYQLKARVQRAEIEIKLAQLFTDLVPVANARGPAMFSDAAVSALVARKPDFTEEDLARLVVATPLGMATQVAAISSIGRLGA